MAWALAGNARPPQKMTPRFDGVCFPARDCSRAGSTPLGMVVTFSRPPDNRLMICVSASLSVVTWVNQRGKFPSV